MEEEKLTLKIQIRRKTHENASEKRNADKKFVLTSYAQDRKIFSRQSRRNTVETEARITDLTKQNPNPTGFDLNSF